MDQYSDLNLHGGQLKTFVVEQRTADPAGTPADPDTDGRLWHDTTDGRFKGRASGATKTLAYMEDVYRYGAHMGGHDASSGLPTVGSGAGGAIEAGDRWLVTTGGTLVGIEGSDVLVDGDWIQALTDGASVAADFAGIEGNQDLSAMASLDSETGVALTAGVAHTITTSLSTLHEVTAKLGGNVVGLDVDLDAQTVTANQNITVDLLLVGAA